MEQYFLLLFSVGCDNFSNVFPSIYTTFQIWIQLVIFSAIQIVRHYAIFNNLKVNMKFIFRTLIKVVLLLLSSQNNDLFFLFTKNKIPSRFEVICYKTDIKCFTLNCDHRKYSVIIFLLYGSWRFHLLRSFKIYDFKWLTKNKVWNIDSISVVELKSDTKCGTVRQ